MIRKLIFLNSNLFQLSEIDHSALQNALSEGNSRLLLCFGIISLESFVVLRLFYLNNYHFLQFLPISNFPTKSFELFERRLLSNRIKSKFEIRALET